mmetsp:Transcript_7444/g.23255  ORF Transcript_7444/g.23255 Transcript_7444/m.23255 type:complete len:85 (-) Transcript_7444:127-381(-)
MIRNHAQSGSGRSLCSGRRRTRARVWTTSLLIHWVWWLRNKKRICRENRKMQKSIRVLSQKKKKKIVSFLAYICTLVEVQIYAV